MKTLLSVKEAALRLGCSEAAIWQWIHQGKFQRVKVGSATRIRVQDVEACIRLGLKPQETIIYGNLIKGPSPTAARYAGIF